MRTKIFLIASVLVFLFVSLFSSTAVFAATAQYSNLVINPTSVNRGQTSNVSVKVTNTGTAGAIQVNLTGWWIMSKTITLSAGASTTVTFAIVPSSTCALGAHTIVIGALSGTLTVTNGSSSPANIVLSNMRLDKTTYDLGDTITLKITATNIGGTSDSKTVTISGDWNDSKSTSNLAPGTSEDITFTVKATQAGSWNVNCATMSVTIVIGGSIIPDPEDPDPEDPDPEDPQPGNSMYGAGANPTGNPIGGGNGYVSPHGYSEATANYVVKTASALTTALSSATSGQVIWIPSGITITVGSSTSAYAKTLKAGVVLASNRGQNGAPGGKIKSLWNGTGYMVPVIYASANSVISGLTFEGVNGLGASSQGAGPCAIKGTTGKHIEVENCEISKFRGGGVYFDGNPGITAWNDNSQRHWIHHSYIHNIQVHGFGYGVGIEGGTQSMLVEACIFSENRHSVMNAGNTTSCYEVRYCIFQDSIYNTNANGTGTWYQSHQVDSHGGGYSGFRAGNHLYIHHNTFSANNSISSKPNIIIRGVVASECKVEYNWTKKTTRTSAPEYNETVLNSFATLAAEEGGAWDGPSSSLSTAHLYVTHNWYGTATPQ